MLYLCYCRAAPTPGLKQGHQDKHDPLCPERGPAEEEGGYNHNEHADDGSDSLTVGFFRVAVLALAGCGTSGHSVAVEGQTDPCVEEDNDGKGGKEVKKGGGQHHVQ